MARRDPFLEGDKVTKRASEGGFTFLDVLAALVVAGLAWATVLSLGVLTRSVALEAERRTTALLVANRKTAEVDLGVERFTSGSAFATGVPSAAGGTLDWRLGDYLRPNEYDPFTICEMEVVWRGERPGSLKVPFGSVDPRGCP